MTYLVVPPVSDDVHSFAKAESLELSNLGAEVTRVESF